MANEKEYLYKVVLEHGTHVDCKFDRAKKLYDKEGIKMYAYTKNLKPTYILMYWKKAEESAFNFLLRNGKFVLKLNYERRFN